MIKNKQDDTRLNETQEYVLISRHFTVQSYNLYT